MRTLVTYFRGMPLIAILCCPNLFGQSTDKNFVLERTYKGQHITVSGNVKDAVQQLNYFDGLGRPLQAVNVQASPQVISMRPSDLVTHTEYDAVGRVSKVYAPYPAGYSASPAAGNGKYAPEAPSKSVAYYNNAANFDQNNARGYALTEYEASSLNRVRKQFAVGSDRAVTLEYGTNLADEVRLYTIAAGNNLVDDNAYYGEGQLSKTASTDENGNLSVEFKDKAGKVVHKAVQAVKAVGTTPPIWLKTYYVYNDLSQLIFVLQPEYQREASLSKYAFKYTYNERGLIDTQYVPGGGLTKMQYDGLDRLTEMEDGNNIITYFKYDELDRVIETGERAGAEYRPLTKMHYDNYLPSFGAAQAFVDNYGNGYPSNKRLDVKGKLTVKATRILNPEGGYSDLASGWYYTTIYYDDQFNVIQTIKSLFDLGGSNNNYEHLTRRLRFDGRVEKELITQKVSTGEYSVEKQYAYDHADRLLSTRYIVKSGTTIMKEIVVAASRYDELGRLKNKFLNSTDGNSFREQLDYRYIPRGWISKVTGKTGTGDNFGVELKYANATIPQYNGNIGEMLWRQGGDWVGYKFTYDNANRLIQGEGLSYDYSETVSGYDLNGNIKALQRKKAGAYWDDLTYSYGNGNRLSKVTDLGTTDGFNNGSSADADDYKYDGNGNLVQDKNRGIADGGIRYNILNLPREVDINGLSMKYHYNAEGSKLRMQRGTENTKYAGVFEYNSSNYLTRIATEEGQIAITNNGADAADYLFQYYLKDHLGNTRQVINEAGTILQETEYFPFGLAIPRTVGTNKYLYNGKEKQPETNWLDYGARMYDPTIGRWMVVDPMAEKFSSLAPYNYVENNPINVIDPSGMESEAITTRYVDPNGKTILNTDDGRSDVYVVNWEQLADFNKNVKYTSPEMLNSVGWNNYWRSEFKQLLPGSLIDQLHASEKGIEALARYALKGDPSDFLTFEVSEIAGQWRDPELVIGSLSTGFALQSVLKKIAARRIGAVFKSVDDVMANPDLLKGKTPQQVEKIIGNTPGWRVEKLGQGSQKGSGWVLRQYNAKGNPTGPQIRWHPGGGHHGPEPYWRVVGANGDLGGVIR